MNYTYDAVRPIPYHRLESSSLRPCCSGTCSTLAATLTPLESASQGASSGVLEDLPRLLVSEPRYLQDPPLDWRFPPRYLTASSEVVFFAALPLRNLWHARGDLNTVRKRKSRRV